MKHSSTTLKFKKRDIHVFVILESLLFSLQFLFFSFFYINPWFLKIQEIIFLSYWAVLLCKEIKKEKKIFSYYVLFLALCFLFNFSRYYLDIIGYTDICVVTFYGHYVLKKETISINLILMQIVLFLIDFSYHNIHLIKVHKTSLSENKFSKKIILCVMTLCLPFSLYGSYLVLKYVIANGYEAYLVQIIGNKENAQPELLLLADHIFKLFFYLSFFYNFNKKETLYIFALYFLDTIMIGVKGSRSSFLFPFFFFSFYLIGYRKIVKISVMKILIFFIFAYLFYSLANNIRGLGTNKTNFLEIINLIFYGLSLSMVLPFVYIEKYSEINSSLHIPYFLTDLINEYHKVDTYNLSSVVTNSSVYGLGSSFFVELFDSGIFLIPLSFLIGIIIQSVNRNLDKNRYLNTFFIILGMSIPWMPRDCILRVFFKTNIMFIIGSFVLYLFLEFSSSFIFKIKDKSHNIRGGGAS